ncbi:hypothetical protein BHE74_00045843 [Ensete ventricosum]|nr:hypothetical protein GW17_00038611 [Ensete ventricosum]RWW48114.1 hypothetical protein BHE74_00045843 [Ensete ventricosum]RZS20466.1 hypothetical protein BHM03_00052981 [Ensete ventricosum]
MGQSSGVVVIEANIEGSCGIGLEIMLISRSSGFGRNRRWRGKRPMVAVVGETTKVTTIVEEGATVWAAGGRWGSDRDVGLHKQRAIATTEEEEGSGKKQRR